MPVRTVKQGRKFAVVDDAGKSFGTHETRKGANAQATAINLSQQRKKGGSKHGSGHQGKTG